MITFEVNKKIIAKTIDNKVKKPCSCCGSKKGRTLIPGFMMQPIQHKLEGLIFLGECVPMVGTYCVNCGHVQNFVLKILLPQLFDK